MSLGEIQQVSQGIYAYLQPDGSWWLNNTGFLVSRDGVISVDAISTERRTRAYLDAIKTVTQKPVRTLVNTHHHGDHTHGNYLMSGATIIGHQRCREAILNSPMPPPPGIWAEVDWGHRAYLELDGAERGTPADLATALGDMVAYNGGEPLTCHA
jgi:cyclase